MSNQVTKIRLIIVGLFLSCCFSKACASTLYVVASSNLQGRSFSQAEIKRILLGEITSINNGRLILIYPSYSSPQIQTLSRFVGKGGSVRNLKSYWSKMIFTGKGNPPLTADSDSQLRELLDSRENSIGVSTTNAGMHVIYTIQD